MKIKITADSTCDLPASVAEKYGVHIFPLYVVMDGVARRDGVEIVAQDIFDHVSAGGKLGNTAAVNIGDYLEKFRALRESYDAIIHFTISESMSACYQNACIAAEEVGNVWVVDSKSLSVGISMLVMDACEMAAAGSTPEEIVAAMEEKREKLDVSFVIDTLDYLRAGGRCSPLVALGANLLNLKPCIELHDGSMDVGKKYRGAIEKVVLKYLADRLADVESIDTRRVFFVKSNGFTEEFLDEARRAVMEACPFTELIDAVAGCTISNHCGPKTLGIIMYRK